MIIYYFLSFVVVFVLAFFNSTFFASSEKDLVLECILVQEPFLLRC